MAKLGVIHYNWPNFSWDDFLRFAAEAGYGSVELALPDVWPDPKLDGEPAAMRESAARARREVESYGLKVSAFSAANDFVQSDRDAIDSQVARMKTVCELTRVLGDNTVVRTEGGAPKEELSVDQQWHGMTECFSRCIPFLDELGVSLAIDNHGLVTNEGDRLIAMLNSIDHPHIGSNLDTMNFRWWGNNVETCNRFYQELAPRVLHVHLKDGFNGRENYQGQALGEGEIDLHHAINCLKEAGYNGVYTAEYEGPEAADGVGYRKCAQWMKENI